MSIGHRVLALLGVALSCGSLLLGLAGAERLLALPTLPHASAFSMMLALATLTAALLVAAVGFICLYHATRRADPAAASRAERHPHGSVTL